MSMFELIFWVTVFLIFYAYFGYPCTLLVIACFRKRYVQQIRITPMVTVIITAYNEEKRIREKIENTLQLKYPRDLIQILVASDGSTDETNSIVQEYGKLGVGLVDVTRGGKENAQKEAVKRACGDILVFSDVATKLGSDSLAQIVSNFADPSVGCVSSEDRIQQQDGQVAGEGLYVRYEMWLRRLESQVYSLVGLSGSYFAARKIVCQDFSSKMQSDFRTLLNSIKMGMRGVCDPIAVGVYPDINNPSRETERKIRTIVRGMTVFFRHLELLNFLRYGIFSFELFCHKLLRWLVPFLIGCALLANIGLAAGDCPAYQFLLIAQVLFYFGGISIYLVAPKVANTLLKIPAYFCAVNIAIAVAWWRYLSGDRIVMWKPSKR